MRVTTVALAVVVACACGPTAVLGTYRPVVLMHGLDASASAMSRVLQWVEADFPGIHVNNVEVGNGKTDSWFMPIEKQVCTLRRGGIGGAQLLGQQLTRIVLIRGAIQVEAFAAAVRADPALANGFNLICHSQGGMLGRAYIAKFNTPPVHNFITWSSPHAGVYGVPDFNAICPDKVYPRLLPRSGTTAATWRDGPLVCRLSCFHTERQLPPLSSPDKDKPTVGLPVAQRALFGADGGRRGDSAGPHRVRCVSAQRVSEVGRGSESFFCCASGTGEIQ